MFAGEHGHHQSAARKHLEGHGGNKAKTILFFVAVPDVNELRKAFYRAMGVPIPNGIQDIVEREDEATELQAIKSVNA